MNDVKFDIISVSNQMSVVNVFKINDGTLDNVIVCNANPFEVLLTQDTQTDLK